MEQMAMRIGCINDSQWRIGGFLTNCSSPKKIRSRNKKINFGLNQQPDCLVIMDADRKSSVILEADRLQIPIVSLVDSNIPLGSYKRITYPIPANDSIQFVYLFCNLITKTVLLERGRIVAMKEPSANWGEKKQLIDRPFPRRIGFSRSVEWSNTDARGDLFMDWTRIVRLRAGLDGTSAGLAQSSYTAANVPGRGALTMRRANKGEFAMLDGRKAATRRVATCSGTTARGDPGQIGMDSSKKAPHAELSRENSGPLN